MTIQEQRPAARYTWAAGQPRAAVPTWFVFEELKKFYRQIASDERNTVVLKADTK
jgi:hypothetical protein